MPRNISITTKPQIPLLNPDMAESYIWRKNELFHTYVQENKDSSFKDTKQVVYALKAQKKTQNSKPFKNFNGDKGPLKKRVKSEYKV